jgi:epsilon-lactone hydrolase
MRKTNFAIISRAFLAFRAQRRVRPSPGRAAKNPAKIRLLHGMEGTMDIQSSLLRLIMAIALSATQPGLAQQPAATPPQDDTSSMDAQGRMHITRVVPLPETISQQARDYLMHPVHHPGPNATLAEVRAATDAMQAHDSALNRALYPVNIEPSSIGGIPVRIVTPVDPIPDAKKERVLINLHGGGFTTDSGSLTESIPIAHLAQTKVIAVLYRLAPEHPFPAAVDDSVAVYKELLRSYRPEHIAIYGASAGGILTAEVAVKIKQLGLPAPGALGIFTGSGDFSRRGDSQAMYSVTGLAGNLNIPKRDSQWISPYVGSADPKDPVLSPLYADLRGMPPSLFLTSTRDMMLSGTTILHRAFLRAGDDAQLVVFEALPHGFWYEAGLPESQEADLLIAHFFDEHLSGGRQ